PGLVLRLSRRSRCIAIFAQSQRASRMRCAAPRGRASTEWWIRPSLFYSMGQARSGKPDDANCLKPAALSRSLDGEICSAAIVAVEPVIETRHTDRGVVDEDKQFLLAIGRNRGRDIELDDVIVRIRLVGALFAAHMPKTQHDAEPILEQLPPQGQKQGEIYTLVPDRLILGGEASDRSADTGDAIEPWLARLDGHIVACAMFEQDACCLAQLRRLEFNPLALVDFEHC